MLIPALLAAAQLAAVPPGEPPARLYFAHMDRLHAVYLDEAFTRPDEDRPGTIRTRSLRVPFNTEHEPYWITERHDCEGEGRSQALWRESAIQMVHDGRADFSGSLQPWNDDASSAVGRIACGAVPIPQPRPAPLSPDDAINAAYDLSLEVRFQPALYEKTGDIGETLDFLGLDSDGVGWFVEPRSDRPDGDGAIIDVLAISGRNHASGERFAWFRVRFECGLDRLLTLQGEHYAEGPRHLKPTPLRATSSPVQEGGMMARIQQYACTPENPPELQAVEGLNSAIAGIVAHVAAQAAPPED